MNWQDVPYAVVANLKLLAPIAHEFAKIAWQHDPDIAAVWYNPYEKHAAVVTADPLVLPEIANVPGVVRVSTEMPPASGDWFLCKTALGVLSGPANAWGATQRLIGGPNPVTAMVTGGLLGSGLGYASGSFFGRNMSPQMRERLRKRHMMLGGILGTAPGLAWGGLQYLGNPEKANSTLQDRGAGWLSPWPFVSPPSLPKENPQPAAGPTESIAQIAPAMDKLASGLRPEDLMIPSIPVDAFNEVVWNDVTRPRNPFGSKSPWGDNSQPLGTPPPVAAATSGLLMGAAAARGGAETVSPMDIALAAAVGGGKGLVAGLVLGKTLSVLAGLAPETQSMLQRTGLWGGALTSAVQRAFGG